MSSELADVTMGVGVGDSEAGLEPHPVKIAVIPANHPIAALVSMGDREMGENPRDKPRDLREVALASTVFPF
jgi:hypothetical protein